MQLTLSDLMMHQSDGCTSLLSVAPGYDEKQVLSPSVGGLKGRLIFFFLGGVSGYTVGTGTAFWAESKWATGEDAGQTLPRPSLAPTGTLPGPPHLLRTPQTDE